MPTLEDYERLAPFNLDELVESANVLLRDRPGQPLSARTVRYYISKGLLPRPSGGPKFARYGIDHLRTLIRIRESQEQGFRLDEVAEADEIVTRMQVPRGRAPRTHRIELTAEVTLEIRSDAPILPLLREAYESLGEMLQEDDG